MRRGRSRTTLPGADRSRRRTADAETVAERGASRPTGASVAAAVRRAGQRAAASARQAVPPPGTAARRAANRRGLDCGRDVRAIDHIGVAVEDLDAAIKLYSEARDAAPAPRDGGRAGRRGGAAGRRRLARRAAARRSATTRRSGSSSPSEGRACTTPPIAATDVASALEHCRARGLRLIDEQPRRGIRGQPGRVPAPVPRPAGC